ncbi:VOC family protein [Kushneria indalinina]|uniref:Catechol 2,3-dioxygenase-like lactoylglutathione lyase family enzyme n=1 Tax=Kushneria indalinina DSM 14324 TaxID=1122140 RepID=A0A3D9DZU3_9GAMM|nr:VOC family protein [Kushneria indalinina]REC95754.1 catechol 2,3-dioxygenase-like lactoylglutathione lyase family enzyme [Kushneria indalinina DSM 14324]
MLSHVMVGSNNLARAGEFYDSLLSCIGLYRQDNDDGDAQWLCYAAPQERILFIVCTPYDQGPATHGNGTLVAFSAHGHELVDQFHAIGMALGATDEGSPAIRSQYHDYFYGAYLRDPDGNKLCCVCHDHFENCP